MRRRDPKSLFLATIYLAYLFCFSTSCAHLTETQKRDYGLLESAVTFSSDAVIGEFGDFIPPDFNSEKFMALVKGKIPEDYYHALEIYPNQVKPMGNYYLIVIYAQQANIVILFDYSCTPEVDGPVLLDPKKYDASNMDLYDNCKN
jgi:hypothetical protein